MLAFPAASSGSVPFAPCSGKRNVECGRVDVPLDRAAPAAGTVGLHVERMMAGTAADPFAARPRRTPRAMVTSAVFALAGGPGQSSSPLIREFALDVLPALIKRDLVTMDQRGTGGSGLLRCPSLESSRSVTPAPEVEQCAATLGTSRGHYTTTDAADDLEAVRAALGYERITLYGTSYGTKLALAYAVRYPSHVERLLLDSVLPLDGPDPFTRDILGAVPRVLRALCSRHACAGITRDPVPDIAALVSRLRSRPLLGRVIGVDSRARMRRLGRLRLLRLLVDGDLDPSLRAEFPAAVKAAIAGDSAPLLRVARRAALGEFDPESARLFSPALFVATTCEDGPVPWRPESAFGDRWGQALANANGLPESAFFPFDRATGRASDDLRLCAHWPPTGPQRPPVAGTPPRVPALVLSGEADLRTPAEGAVAVARQIPGATALVLPGTGHAALLNDLSFCAVRAVDRFFRDRPVSTRCPRSGQVLRELLSFAFLPTPIPPTSLAVLPSSGDSAGRRGRTMTAFVGSLVDSVLQQLYAALTGSGTGRAIPGLRGGRIRTDGRLDHYSYVPGVTVTDVSRPHRIQSLEDLAGVLRFRIAGTAASHGVLEINLKRFAIEGTLGGRPVRLDLRDIGSASRRGAPAVARLARLARLVHHARRLPRLRLAYHCCRYVR